MKKLEYKTKFLSMIFGLTILDSDELNATYKRFDELIEDTKKKKTKVIN